MTQEQNTCDRETIPTIERMKILALIPVPDKGKPVHHVNTSIPLSSSITDALVDTLCQKIRPMMEPIGVRKVKVVVGPGEDWTCGGCSQSYICISPEMKFSPSDDAVFGKYLKQLVKSCLMQFVQYYKD